MSAFDPVAWYKQQRYAGEHDIDPRCLHVLAAWQNLYNIYRDGENRPDGGWRQTGTPGAVMVRVREALSTFDDSALTRLVVAAHVHHCRVSVQPCRSAGVLIITVHPRKSEGGTIERHPGTLDLLSFVAEQEARAHGPIPSEIAS